MAPKIPPPPPISRTVDANPGTEGGVYERRRIPPPPPPRRREFIPPAISAGQETKKIETKGNLYPNPAAKLIKAYPELSEFPPLKEVEKKYSQLNHEFSKLESKFGSLLHPRMKESDREAIFKEVSASFHQIEKESERITQDWEKVSTFLNAPERKRRFSEKLLIEVKTEKEKATNLEKLLKTGAFQKTFLTLTGEVNHSISEIERLNTKDSAETQDEGKLREKAQGYANWLVSFLDKREKWMGGELNDLSQMAAPFKGQSLALFSKAAIRSYGVALLDDIPAYHTEAIGATLAPLEFPAEIEKKMSHFLSPQGFRRTIDGWFKQSRHPDSPAFVKQYKEITAFLDGLVQTIEKQQKKVEADLAFCQQHLEKEGISREETIFYRKWLITCERARDKLKFFHIQVNGVKNYSEKIHSFIQTSLEVVELSKKAEESFGFQIKGEKTDEKGEFDQKILPQLKTAEKKLVGLREELRSLQIKYQKAYSGEGGIDLFAEMMVSTVYIRNSKGQTELNQGLFPAQWSIQKLSKGAEVSLRNIQTIYNEYATDYDQLGERLKQEAEKLGISLAEFTPPYDQKKVESALKQLSSVEDATFTAIDFTAPPRSLEEGKLRKTFETRREFLGRLSSLETKLDQLSGLPSPEMHEKLKELEQQKKTIEHYTPFYSLLKKRGVVASEEEFFKKFSIDPQKGFDQKDERILLETLKSLLTAYRTRDGKEDLTPQGTPKFYQEKETELVELLRKCNFSNQEALELASELLQQNPSDSPGFIDMARSLTGFDSDAMALKGEPLYPITKKIYDRLDSLNRELGKQVQSQKDQVESEYSISRFQKFAKEEISDGKNKNSLISFHTEFVDILQTFSILNLESVSIDKNGKSVSAASICQEIQQDLRNILIKMHSLRSDEVTQILSQLQDGKLDQKRMSKLLSQIKRFDLNSFGMEELFSQLREKIHLLTSEIKKGDNVVSAQLENAPVEADPFIRAKELTTVIENKGAVSRNALYALLLKPFGERFGYLSSESEKNVPEEILDARYKQLLVLFCKEMHLDPKKEITPDSLRALLSYNISKDKQEKINPADLKSPLVQAFLRLNASQQRISFEELDLLKSILGKTGGLYGSDIQEIANSTVEELKAKIESEKPEMLISISDETYGQLIFLCKKLTIYPQAFLTFSGTAYLATSDSDKIKEMFQKNLLKPEALESWMKIISPLAKTFKETENSIPYSHESIPIEMLVPGSYELAKELSDFHSQSGYSAEKVLQSQRNISAFIKRNIIGHSSNKRSLVEQIGIRRWFNYLNHEEGSFEKLLYEETKSMELGELMDSFYNLQQERPELSEAAVAAYLNRQPIDQYLQTDPLAQHRFGATTSPSDLIIPVFEQVDGKWQFKLSHKDPVFQGEGALLTLKKQGFVGRKPEEWLLVIQKKIIEGIEGFSHLPKEIQARYPSLETELQFAVLILRQKEINAGKNPLEKDGELDPKLADMLNKLLVILENVSQQNISTFNPAIEEICQLISGKDAPSEWVEQSDQASNRFFESLDQTKNKFYSLEPYSCSFISGFVTKYTLLTEEIRNYSDQRKKKEYETDYEPAKLKEFQKRLKELEHGLDAVKKEKIFSKDRLLQEVITDFEKLLPETEKLLRLYEQPDEKAEWFQHTLRQRRKEIEDFKGSGGAVREVLNQLPEAVDKAEKAYQETEKAVNDYVQLRMKGASPLELKKMEWKVGEAQVRLGQLTRPLAWMRAKGMEGYDQAKAEMISWMITFACLAAPGIGATQKLGSAARAAYQAMAGYDALAMEESITLVKQLARMGAETASFEQKIMAVEKTGEATEKIVGTASRLSYQTLSGTVAGVTGELAFNAGKGNLTQNNVKDFAKKSFSEAALMVGGVEAFSTSHHILKNAVMRSKWVLGMLSETAVIERNAVKLASGETLVLTDTIEEQAIREGFNKPGEKIIDFVTRNGKTALEVTESATLYEKSLEDSIIRSKALQAAETFLNETTDPSKREATRILLQQLFAQPELYWELRGIEALNRNSLVPFSSARSSIESTQKETAKQTLKNFFEKPKELLNDVERNASGKIKLATEEIEVKGARHLFLENIVIESATAAAAGVPSHMAGGPLNQLLHGYGLMEENPYSSLIPTEGYSHSILFGPLYSTLIAPLSNSIAMMRGRPKDLPNPISRQGLASHPVPPEAYMQRDIVNHFFEILGPGPMGQMMSRTQIEMLRTEMKAKEAMEEAVKRLEG